MTLSGRGGQYASGGKARPEVGGFGGKTLFLAQREQLPYRAVGYTTHRQAQGSDRADGEGDL